MISVVKQDICIWKIYLHLYRISNTKVMTDSSDSYKVVIKYLCESYATYQLKDEQALWVVIRDLHNSTPLDKLRNNWWTKDLSRAINCRLVKWWLEEFFPSESYTSYLSTLNIHDKSSWDATRKYHSMSFPLRHEDGTWATDEEKSLEFGQYLQKIFYFWSCLRFLPPYLKN